MSSVRSGVRRPPGAEPCRPKPEGYWTALPCRGRQARAVRTATAPQGSLAHTLHSSPRVDSPRNRPGVLRHIGAAVTSALPHDRRVRNAGPGQTHPAAMAGNSPVPATCWRNRAGWCGTSSVPSGTWPCQLPHKEELPKFQRPGSPCKQRS